MWFVSFSKANCKNCYACVRVCPVNAIEVKNEQAQIIKERCIVCGKCFKSCPQNAKVIRTEKNLIKKYLETEKNVVVSVAPSFAATFASNSNKIPTALRNLGFNFVEQTIVGVEPIIEQYKIYADKDDNNSYITSFCPSVNSLIQKHYPNLIKNLIPVVSPSVCHGRLIKKKYGHDTKVVFIGPCIAKKTDSHDEDSIDAVLTFEELEKWLKVENINLSELEASKFDDNDEDKALSPIVGELTKQIKEKKIKRKVINVDGIEDCIEILEAIGDGKFKNTLIEMSSCRHSCIGGSGMPDDDISCYERIENLKDYSVGLSISDKKDKEPYPKDIEINKNFESLNIPLQVPTEEEIKGILNSMGKYAKPDELNCASCGYKSCRDKAVAVYNGMAEKNMCVPFMRQKSENIKNVLFDTTPNLVIIIDKELDIIQINPAAEKFFNIEKGKVEGLPVIMFLEEEIFNKVKNNKRNIYKEKVELLQNNATVIQSVIWLENNQVMIWIADDITKNEQIDKKHKKMKMDAITITQEVINKQMTVAQEIASLLGETTAETKVTLTRLKNLIQEEELSKS